MDTVDRGNSIIKWIVAISMFIIFIGVFNITSHIYKIETIYVKELDKRQLLIDSLEIEMIKYQTSISILREELKRRKGY